MTTARLGKPAGMKVIEHHAFNDTIRLGKLTSQQESICALSEWSLEAFPGDDDRLRVVLGTGERGPWFSRQWNPIGWKRFWPPPHG